MMNSLPDPELDALGASCPDFCSEDYDFESDCAANFATPHFTPQIAQSSSGGLADVPGSGAVELSDGELDAIAGGFVDVSFSLFMSEDIESFSVVQGPGFSSQSGYRKRSRFGLEFSGRFESMAQVSSFFSEFMSLFGRR
jgi:hypothetical protein